MAKAIDGFFASDGDCWRPDVEDPDIQECPITTSRQRGIMLGVVLFLFSIKLYFYEEQLAANPFYLGTRNRANFIYLSMITSTYIALFLASVWIFYKVSRNWSHR